MDIRFRVYREYCKRMGLKESNFKNFRHFMIMLGCK